MVRYLVYGNGALYGENYEPCGGRPAALNKFEAEKVATRVAKAGLSVAIFVEVTRFDPAEPVKSEAR